MNEDLNNSMISEAVLDAEKVVLTNAMSGSGRFEDLTEKGISGSTFTSKANRVIWEVLDELLKSGDPFEAMTITKRLEATGNLDVAGGISRVAEIFYDVTRNEYSLNIALGLVKEWASKRAWRDYSLKVHELAIDGTVKAEEVLARSEQMMSAMRDQCGVVQIPTVREACSRVLDNLEWRSTHPGELRGFSTGFRRLDALIDGLVGKRLIIIAARPAVGKTAVLVNILSHCFLRSGLKVALFSLEMPIDQIVERAVFAEAKYNPEGLRTGQRMTQGDMVRITKAMSKMRSAPFMVDDTPGLSIDRLQARARRMVRENGVQVIGIDYIGIMKGSSRQFNSREREVAEISSGLQMLAKELNIPIIALAQLNRGPESRQGGVPQLSDLRESGSLEQDADQVIFLHRPVLYDPKADPREAKALLRKNRHGSTGVIDMTWEAEYTTYREVDNRAGEANPTIRGVLPDPETNH